MSGQSGSLESQIGNWIQIVNECGEWKLGYTMANFSGRLSFALSFVAVGEGGLEDNGE